MASSLYFLPQWCSCCSRITCTFHPSPLISNLSSFTARGKFKGFCLRDVADTATLPTTKATITGVTISSSSSPRTTAKEISDDLGTVWVLFRGAYGKDKWTCFPGDRVRVAERRLRRCKASASRMRGWKRLLTKRGTLVSGLGLEFEGNESPT